MFVTNEDGKQRLSPRVVEQRFATIDSLSAKAERTLSYRPDFFQLAENAANSGRSLLRPIQNRGINTQSPPVRPNFGTPSVRLNSRTLRLFMCDLRPKPKELTC